jgi:bile acid:Na+ symporter, BASS family
MISFFSQFATFIDINLWLQMVLALIMLSVGLSLNLADFRYVFQNFSLLLKGLILKIVLIPLLFFSLLHFYPISPTWQFGILILLLCPGGTTSNVITYWFRGTSSLTIFLTTLSGFITVFTLPFFINEASLFYFGETASVALPFWKTAGEITTIIILPSIIGLGIHRFFPRVALALERVIKPGSVLLLALVYLIKFFAVPDNGTGSNVSTADVLQLLPLLLVVNFVSLLIGFFVPRRWGVSFRDAFTIGIEMGVQNAGLAILIGDVFLANHEFSKPALIYAMFSFFTTVAFAFVSSSGWLSRRSSY